jgi:hypothetical protein
MFSKLVSVQDAAYLLDIQDRAALDRAADEGLLKTAQSGAKGNRYQISEIVLYKLAQTITHVGVEPQKAGRYAEAVLGPRLMDHDKNALEWIEDDSQELFCLIADDQLTRIFLRNKEDSKEVDIGAVRPVLFPIITCEINVFRVIRPVVYRARHLHQPH